MFYPSPTSTPPICRHHHPDDVDAGDAKPYLGCPAGLDCAGEAAHGAAIYTYTCRRCGSTRDVAENIGPSCYGPWGRIDDLPPEA